MMEESLLWAVALGAGVLGLLLLAVAVVVAIYLNIKGRGVEDGDSADGSPTRAEAADPSKSNRVSRQEEDASGAERASVGSFWAWVKAWVFAAVHAATVSLVLGAITFFEDLAKAGDEIETTGTVTFPKQLLPGPLAGSMSRRRLAQPSDADDLENLDLPDEAASETPGWEVVDLLEETEARGKR